MNTKIIRVTISKFKCIYDCKTKKKNLVKKTKISNYQLVIEN